MEGLQIFLWILLGIYVGFILGFPVYDRIKMHRKMKRDTEIVLITLRPLVEKSIEEISNSEEFKKINAEEYSEKRP